MRAEAMQRFRISHQKWQNIVNGTSWGLGDDISIEGNEIKIL